MPLASNAQFYDGSRLLSPVSVAAGLSIDKVNFVAAQLAAVACGCVLHRSPGGQQLRRLLHIGTGLSLLWFCFGHQALHMLLQFCIAYCLLLLLPTRASAVLVPAYCLLHLCLCHLLRLEADYSGYTMDITTPLMIQTQKLAGLAVAIHDAQLLRCGRQLRPNHSLHNVQKVPSVTECLCYLLFPPSLLAGPHIFYSDFNNYFTGCVHPPRDGSQLRAAAKALAAAAAFGLLQLLLAPVLPYTWVVSDAFAQLGAVRKLLYMLAAFAVVRCKYYFAWSLAEAACLATGYGFSGYDSVTKQPQYLLAKNFFLLDVETGSSVRTVVAGWNVQTARWLREIVYERTPERHATLLTFIVSAVWHGFYPGYYCFFLTFALFTFAGRRVRRVVRPQVTGTAGGVFIYNLATAVASHLAQNYAQGVFFLLEMRYAMRFWSALYFSGHILCGLLLLCIPPVDCGAVPKIITQCVLRAMHSTVGYWHRASS